MLNNFQEQKDNPGESSISFWASFPTFESKLNNEQTRSSRMLHPSIICPMMALECCEDKVLIFYQKYTKHV